MNKIQVRGRPINPLSKRQHYLTLVKEHKITRDKLNKEIYGYAKTHSFSDTATKFHMSYQAITKRLLIYIRLNHLPMIDKRKGRKVLKRNILQQIKREDLTIVDQYVYDQYMEQYEMGVKLGNEKGALQYKELAQKMLMKSKVEYNRYRRIKKLNERRKSFNK